MKTRIFIICVEVILCINLSFAQEQGKFRGGFELGTIVPIEGKMGWLFSMEVKYNFKDNMNVGFQTEFMGIIVDKNNSESLNMFSMSYDYYFHKRNKSFSPFIGGGLGYYFCNDYDAGQEIRTGYNNPACFIRAGFEIEKFRISLKYNVIRKSSAESYIRNSDYVALNIGFYIGGGKWKK